MLTPAIYHNRGDTLYPIDTYIDGQTATVNYSTAVILRMRTIPNTIYITYPILRFTGNIKTKKTLRLYFQRAGSVTGQNVAIDVINNVDINTVIYTTPITVLNSVIGQGNIGSSIQTDANGNLYKDIDLSAFLSQFHENIITFRLRATVLETQTTIAIFSSESILKPRLI